MRSAVGERTDVQLRRRRTAVNALLATAAALASDQGI
jgi:hypothetical protein